MENLALNTNEVFIFGHENMIFSYFLKYFEKKTTFGSKMFGNMRPKTFVL